MNRPIVFDSPFLLGFEHTCVKPDEPARVDDDGNPVPSCLGQQPVEITEPTMYFDQACGETKKATLEPDDIDAACSVYPIAEDPAACEPATLDDPGGCCGTNRGAGAHTALLALGVLVGLRRTRRRRR